MRKSNLIRRARSTPFSHGERPSLSTESQLMCSRPDMKPDMKSFRKGGPLNLRNANNPNFMAVIDEIVKIILGGHARYGGFYRNSPHQDVYSFRLVCKAFKRASIPLFEATFFKTRQGTVGTQSLQPLLHLSKTRLSRYVECLVLNLFPTDWRPQGTPLYQCYPEKQSYSIATYWDESKYHDWLADVNNWVSSNDIVDTLVDILQRLPNLESVCVNAFSFNEFFAASRRNYTALVAQQHGIQGFDFANYRLAVLSLASDQVGYHHLLQIWNRCLRACYRAFQRVDTLNLQRFKLRVPQDMFRFGDPPFPRDVFLQTSMNVPISQAWYNGLEELSISIVVLEPTVPQQLGQLAQTNDRWISQLLCGMQNIKKLSIRSTDAEFFTNNPATSGHQKSLVLYRTPTSITTSIQMNMLKSLRFSENAPWQWPHLHNLTELTLSDVQVSHGGAIAFLNTYRNTLKTLRLDGVNYIYSEIENQGWFDFILQAVTDCNIQPIFTSNVQLLSFMWISGRWRVTETYSPRHAPHQMNLENWRSWSQVFKQTNPEQAVVHPEVLLSNCDYHEKLPRRINPFFVIPHFEVFDITKCNGSDLVNNKLVIRCPVADKMMHAKTESRFVFQKRPMLRSLAARIRSALKQNI
jgi:hypothetical protein